MIWSYTGLSTPDSALPPTANIQLSSNVNGIKNIEAQTFNGLSIKKASFQPDVNLDLAIARIVSATNAIRALMPPGIQPPIVVQFNASSVPVLQISLSSNSLNEQQLYDYGIYKTRAAAPPGLEIKEFIRPVDICETIGRGCAARGCDSERAAAAHCRNSGCRRCALTAGSRCSRLYGHDRSCAGDPARAYCKQRRHQRQCQPQFIRTGHALAIPAAGAPVPGLLSNVATFKRESVPTNANQTDIQPVYEIYASVEGRDLGNVTDEISRIVTKLQKQLSPGNSVQVVGIQSMNDAFRNLGVGLLFAAVLVYLLMVVNYQNFGDPFVVILALPATFCGILTMLFATGTTLNVPSLMGAIMAVGVASANSILLVTFAREQQLAGRSAHEAAIDAGHTRIRPVPITATVMIVGMMPMAIGGAGKEQNAALARAVNGGLLFATQTTLLVVPYLFAMLRSGNDGKAAHGVFSEDTA